VRLAAAEVGLQLHHRIAALARQALRCPHEEVLETLREVGATEKLGRLQVLVAALAQMHLLQVGPNSACWKRPWPRPGAA